MRKNKAYHEFHDEEKCANVACRASEEVDADERFSFAFYTSFLSPTFHEHNRCVSEKKN